MPRRRDRVWVEEGREGREGMAGVVEVLCYVIDFRDGVKVWPDCLEVILCGERLMGLHLSVDRCVAW